MRIDCLLEGAEVGAPHLLEGSCRQKLTGRNVPYVGLEDANAVPFAPQHHDTADPLRTGTRVVGMRRVEQWVHQDALATSHTVGLEGKAAPLRRLSRSLADASGRGLDLDTIAVNDEIAVRSLVALKVRDPPEHARDAQLRETPV